MNNNSKIEEWRPIQGYEELYQVSSLGRVRSCDRYVPNSNGIGVRLHRGRILKAGMSGHDYLQVVLSKDGKTSTFRVHRLVGMAFQDVCGQFRNGLEIDHLDTDPSNNRATNLRWATKKENNNNPLTRQHRSDSKKGDKNPMYGGGEKHPSYGKFGKDNPTSKPIIQMDRQGNFLSEFECLLDAERKLGICNQNVSKVLRGIRKTAGSFKWKYKTA